MQTGSFRMRRQSPYPPIPAPTPARAHTSMLAGAWPFPDSERRASPEIRRAALNVLHTTARDWGLAASR